MSYNDPDTLPQYRVPEDITLDTLGAYLEEILKRFYNGGMCSGDFASHGEALELFMWRKFGDPEIATYPMWDTDPKFRIYDEIIDAMCGPRFRGVWLRKDDVPHYLKFLNAPLGKVIEALDEHRQYVERQRILLEK